MSDIIFEVVKLIVMVLAMITARYLIPWIKEVLGADRLAVIEKWTKYAVEMAQQVYWNEDGAQRKEIVTKFLKEILIEKNLSISDEQLEVLIEAAVKEMKMQDSVVIAGIEEGGSDE